MFACKDVRIFSPPIWSCCNCMNSLNPYVEGAVNQNKPVIRSSHRRRVLPPLVYLRKSGALTIMCWKSSSERRPSLSRSASSITFSHTILTSSSVSSLRVSLFRVFPRSDLQMKSSLLKSSHK